MSNSVRALIKPFKMNNILQLNMLLYLASMLNVPHIFSLNGGSYNVQPQTRSTWYIN